MVSMVHKLIMRGGIVRKLPMTSTFYLLWLPCLLSQALASEVCMIPFGNEYLMFYIKCPDYCCKYTNSTQYCCGDCSLSVNANSCAPEMIWRYVLYVGLGIAGCIVLCYFVIFIIKNYKESMKRACCKQMTSRVQDPSVSMTSASAWTDPRSRARRQAVGESVDSAVYDEYELCDRRYFSGRAQPPPPAYSNAAFTVADSGGEGSEYPTQPQPCARAATPPPTYSADTEAAAAAVVAAAAANLEEPPPAYSESVDSQYSIHV